MVRPATPENVRRAARLLRASGVVAFPTETVYGLGAVAFDARAVARIFAIKQRPAFDPLIVHVRDAEMLSAVVAEIPDAAKSLIERFWPGALTLVLSKRTRVPEIVTAGLPTVAVRMPSHPVARMLLDEVGEPLAAPSANPFGRMSPTRAEHVAQALGERVDLILDGGRSTVGLESTILALEPVPVLLRSGAVPVEEIEAVVGPVRRAGPSNDVQAPGQLPVHYAPRTRLRLIDPEGVPMADRSKAAALSLRQTFEGYAATRALSPSGDLQEAAASLFETLHEFDALGLERIDAQPFPEDGLGAAIMDRLRRASAS